MTEQNEIEQSYRLCRPKMLRLAALMLRDEAWAEDVVSEVFLNLLRSQWPERNAEGFLLTAVRNRCLNQLKAKQAKPAHIEIDERLSHTLSDHHNQNENRLEEIEQFINRYLTDQTQRVLTLRFRERMKYQEIATELSISEAAVYKHLAKGLEKLKKRFNP